MNEFRNFNIFPQSFAIQPSEDDNNNHPFVGKIYEISHVKAQDTSCDVYKVFNDKNKLSSLSYQLHGSWSIIYKIFISKI